MTIEHVVEISAAAGGPPDGTDSKGYSWRRGLLGVVEVAILEGLQRFEKAKNCRWEEVSV